MSFQNPISIVVCLVCLASCCPSGFAQKIVGERGININDTLPPPALQTLSGKAYSTEVARRRVEATLSNVDILRGQGKAFEALEQLLDIYQYEPLLAKGRHAQVYLNLGIAKSLQELGTDLLATRFFERAYLGLKTDTYTDTSQLYLVSSYMAASLLRIGRKTEAEQNYKAAYELVEDWNPLFAAGALNELGMLYQQTGRPDSAAYFFRKALDNTTAEIQDEFLRQDIRFAIHDNLGLLEEARGNHTAAKQYFMINLNQAALSETHIRRKVQACFRLSNLALRNGQLATAESYLQAGKRDLKKTVAPYNTHYSRWALKLEIQSQHSTGQTAGLDDKLNALTSLTDSVQMVGNRSLDAAFAKLLEFKIKESAQTQALQAAEAEQAQYKLYLQRQIAISLLLILGVVFAGLGGGCIAAISKSKSKHCWKPNKTRRCS